MVGSGQGAVGAGHAPREAREQDEGGRLGGVHFYSLLCEQVLGRRPKEVQLLYLAEPVAIITVPTSETP